MSLNRADASRVGYQAKIEWYKERAADISEGKVTLADYLKEKNTDFEATQHTPDELIDVLGDLVKKATKLEDKVAFLSAKLIIPVDKVAQPELANMIASIDSVSKGEFISYALYDKLLKEYESANNSVDLNYIVGGATGDVQADSVMIHDKILQGYASMAGSESNDQATQTYGNRWLNNIFSWNEHEYQVRQILSFSDNYLDINPDPAYIPWSMRRDIGEERIDAQGNQDLWKQFSDTYSKEAGGLVDGIKGLASLKMDTTVHDLTTRYITYANSFLNKVNTMFDLQWAVDLVCCFAQWGVKLDTKTLKGIRALLQLLQTGLSFDFRDVLNGIKDIINNIFRGLLTNQLVGLIRQIIDSLVDPIKKWINQPDDVWKKIFACTPIDELINKYIVQAIAYVESLLFNLIQNWYKKIELKNIKNNIKIDLKTNQKWMGELASLLDAIIAVTEKAAQCGLNNSPSSEAVPTLVANYSLNNPEKYQFPEEPSPNIYNSFIPETPVVTDVDSVSAVQTTQFDQGARGGQVSINRPASYEDCLKKIPQDQVQGVREWIEILNSKAQGSV